MISREGAVAVPWPAVRAARSRESDLLKKRSNGNPSFAIDDRSLPGAWSAEYRFLAAAQSATTSGWRALSDGHRGRLRNHYCGWTFESTLEFL